MSSSAKESKIEVKPTKSILNNDADDDEIEEKGKGKGEKENPYLALYQDEQEGEFDEYNGEFEAEEEEAEDPFKSNEEFETALDKWAEMIRQKELAERLANEEEEEESFEESSQLTSDQEFLLTSDSDFMVDSDPEQRTKRRLLIGKDSFLKLQVPVPGLAEALDPKDETLEQAKGYPPGSIKEMKNNYKKLCHQFGILPLHAFLKQIHSEVMDLERYGLHGIEIEAICKSLHDNPYVRVLLMSGNLAGKIGGDAIAELIEKNSMINHLAISAMDLKPAMKNIGEALVKNHAIQNIDLSANNFTDKEMPYLIPYLQETISLRDLNLGRNHIADQGIVSLAKGINANLSLEVLDFGWNWIKGLKWTTPFFMACANHPILCSLNLFGNSLPDGISGSIARMMLNNKQLEFLDLSFNRLDVGSTGPIANGFRRSGSMKELTVGPNRFRQIPASTILQPLTNLKRISPIEYLNFGAMLDVHKEFLDVKKRVIDAYEKRYSDPIPEVKKVEEVEEEEEEEEEEMGEDYDDDDDEETLKRKQKEARKLGKRLLKEKEREARREAKREKLARKLAKKRAKMSANEEEEEAKNAKKQAEENDVEEEEEEELEGEAEEEEIPKEKSPKEKLRIILIHGEPYGIYNPKAPTIQQVILRRAKIVCESFETPLEALINQLRGEHEAMSEKAFKKFIKSVNLYKDKKLTKGFMKHFSKPPREVDCQAIIDEFDKEFPEADQMLCRESRSKLLEEEKNKKAKKPKKDKKDKKGKKGSKGGKDDKKKKKK